MLTLIGVGAWYTQAHIEKLDRSEAENPADDLKGALEYEFNMTKDPATGRIPEGIFEAERAQANEIVDRQQRLSIPELGSYSFVGPENLGGRTRSIVYDVRYNGTSNQTMLACGITGGVFKSTNDGASWVRKSPLGEHFSCTSLAQDPRAGSQDTWYYAVGEATGNSASASGASYLGNGVYKSTDNGETWTRLPASNAGALESFDTNTDAINKVVVDPTNGNIYIAALATILRSTDGGSTWNAVLSGTFSNTEGLTDVVVTSAGRFYAAFAGAIAGGADGVWASDTGASGSWNRIAGPAGTPAGWNAQGGYGRVVLAIAPSNENIVYALYDNGTVSSCTGTAAPEAKLFRWVNNTSTWTNLSATMPDEPGCTDGNDPFGDQGGYDLVVAVKPDDAATVFIAGTNVYRSTDSGATWTRIAGYASANGYGQYANSHPDIHVLVFQPGSPSILICGNDGGIQRTTDDLAANVAWTQINSGFRTYQYVYVVNDPRTGNNKVIGGAQDNGTTRNIGGTGSSFESVYSGDGVSVGLSNLVAGTQYEYVGSQNGNIQRRPSTDPDGSSIDIRPAAATANGLFYTLFKLDSDNTERLYYVSDNSLYRTTTASTVTTGTWTAMTGVTTAVGGGNMISAVGLSRGAYNAGTSSMFIGTNNGKVFRLDDPTGVAAGTAPVDITGAGFPANANVSSISANPANDDTVLVTFSNYGVVSVFWTGNANAASPTWTAVEGSLTLPSYRSSAIVNTPTGLQYFVGTSTGLYSTSGLPGTPAWTQEGPGAMGNAVVSSLDLRPEDNKLLVGTHGYAMWTSNFPVGSRKTIADFDGDGRTDVSVFRPTEGNWYLNRSTAGLTIVQWGLQTDTLIPGDYDGDGKADFAIFRASDTPGVGDFYILNSNGFTVNGYEWGLTSDIPMAGDYDGDGKIDIAVYRPSTTMWYIRKSQTQTVDSFQFGAAGDVPMVMDFNGDGKTDLAVFRSSDRTWYMANASGTPAQTFTNLQWGLSTDILVPADYDGDKKDDVAVFRPLDGTWYIHRSTDGGTTFTLFGQSGDVPVPGDYDGDGKNDAAVYRDGTWYENRSTAGFSAHTFGLTSDRPIPAAYHP